MSQLPSKYYNHRPHHYRPSPPAKLPESSESSSGDLTIEKSNGNILTRVCKSICALKIIKNIQERVLSHSSSISGKCRKARSYSCSNLKTTRYKRPKSQRQLRLTTAKNPTTELGYKARLEHQRLIARRIAAELDPIKHIPHRSSSCNSLHKNCNKSTQWTDTELKKLEKLAKEPHFNQQTISEPQLILETNEGENIQLEESLEEEEEVEELGDKNLITEGQVCEINGEDDQDLDKDMNNNDLPSSRGENPEPFIPTEDPKIYETVSESDPEPEPEPEPILVFDVEQLEPLAFIPRISKPHLNSGSRSKLKQSYSTTSLAVVPIMVDDEEERETKTVKTLGMTCWVPTFTKTRNSFFLFRNNNVD